MVAAIAHSSPSSVNWLNPIDWRHHLNRGLQNWWLNVPHWQGGTTWRDLCGRQHGTLTNMAPATDWKSSTTREGGWGALDFAGTADYEVAWGSGTQITTTLPFTLSFWMNLDDYGNDFNCPIKLQGDVKEWMIYFNTNNAAFRPMSFGTGNADSWIETQVTNDFSAALIDTWAHFVLTFDGVDDVALSSYAVYYNGKSEALEAAGNLPGADNESLFGGDGGAAGANAFDGMLDDIRLYDRRLNAAEATALYDASRNYQRGLLNRISVPVMPVAAAGGTSVPVFEMHYKQMRACA